MLIASYAGEFRRYRSLAERAIERVPEAQRHAPLTPDGNSIAILMQHIGGNLTSRFHDLLHADGEASWRQRDQEFEERRLSPDELRTIWDKGWQTLETSLDGLVDGDLARTITIRQVPLTVAEALARSLAHVAYHTGQVILIAQTHVGQGWQSLSVPKGASVAYAKNPTLEKPPQKET